MTVVGGATGNTKLGKTRTGWHGASLLPLLYPHSSTLLLLLLGQIVYASFGCNFVYAASNCVGNYRIALSLLRCIMKLFPVLADVNANGTTMNVRDVAVHAPDHAIVTESCRSLLLHRCRWETPLQTGRR